MLSDAHLHLFRRGYGVPAIAARLGGQSDVAAYELIRQVHGIGRLAETASITCAIQ